MHFREEEECQKSVQNPALGLYYLYLARLSPSRVTQKSDYRFGFFSVELGEEYLSIVSMQFGHGNGQAFVLTVDHDSFFNLTRLSPS